MKIKQTIIALALLSGITYILISPAVYATGCGGVNTAIINCDGGGTGVLALLTTAIKIMTAGVGILAVGGVVYGAILYTSANGSMEQTKKAKEVIYNVAFGLIAYALMFSFLNFIIPGGVFS
jgi:hypothetical protein